MLLPHTRRWMMVALTGASVVLSACGSRQEFNTPAPSALGAAPAAEAKGRTSGVTITVIDAAARPLAGASVALLDAGGASVGPEIKTDVEGRASFPKVPPGKGYQAVARLQELRATHALDVENEAPVLVTVLVAPANAPRGTIGGAVLDAVTGRPLHGATVSVVGISGSTRSNADGSFLLKAVPVGTPIVLAHFPGFREQRLGVALRAGASMRADFRLVPARDLNRLGHTWIATSQAVLELDSATSRLAQLRRGAGQVRVLANGHLLLATSQGVEEVTPTGTSVWSYKPLVLGRLSQPQGVHRAASGNTFIADTGNDRVIEVSSSQQVQRTLKVDLARPMSVERLDLSKTTLVADTGHHRVIEVNDAGRIVWGFGDGDLSNLNRPTHATRLPNGNTLVTDTGNSRILEITPDHRLAWDFGGDGNRATCFLPNSAVRLPNGNTLIADTGNQRVIEVSPAREVVWRAAVEAPLFAERY
ncbi:MAG: carboxypeptidase regulatory-like domain-containing protein [Candidatus Sericytochromatia bacterium]|nr:carboxypeptidase regulatory-like domain-containing protein [Candidatus Sericytochromatia bacterium]